MLASAEVLDPKITGWIKTVESATTVLWKVGSPVSVSVQIGGDDQEVRVTIVAQHPAFQPALRNGIMSNPYGPCPGYRIEVNRAGAANPKQ